MLFGRYGTVNGQFAFQRYVAVRRIKGNIIRNNSVCFSTFRRFIRRDIFVCGGIASCVIGCGLCFPVFSGHIFAVFIRRNVFGRSVRFRFGRIRYFGFRDSLSVIVNDIFIVVGRLFVVEDFTVSATGRLTVAGKVITFTADRLSITGKLIAFTADRLSVAVKCIAFTVGRLSV